MALRTRSEGRKTDPGDDLDPGQLPFVLSNDLGFLLPPDLRNALLVSVAGGFFFARMLRRAQVLSEDFTERAIAIIAVPGVFPAGMFVKRASGLQLRTHYPADVGFGVGGFLVLTSV